MFLLQCLGFCVPQQRTKRLCETSFYMQIINLSRLGPPNTQRPLVRQAGFPLLGSWFTRLVVDNVAAGERRERRGHADPLRKWFIFRNFRPFQSEYRWIGLSTKEGWNSRWTPVALWVVNSPEANSEILICASVIRASLHIWLVITCCGDNFSLPTSLASS